MSNSSLVNVKIPAHSSNYSKGRSGRKINKIAIHHMAGILTIEQCGNIFQKAGRNGSSHYGVGNDGRIGVYVDEENTAWTNSNWDSNCESVTIEVSNSVVGGNWEVSDKALNSTIKLVADIAKRNNIKLEKGKTVVWHSMYVATTCPGPYLLGKIDYIIAEANKILKGSTTNKTTNNNTTTKNKGYLVQVTANILNIRAGAGTNHKVVGQIKDKGTYTIVEESNGVGATKWGRLKSGVGWISLDFTSKVSNKQTTYTVKAGDTLSEIAVAYNTTVDSIVKKNNIKDKDKICIGQVLKI